MIKGNNGNKNIFVKIMAGALAGLMVLSMCYIPIAYLVQVINH